MSGIHSNSSLSKAKHSWHFNSLHPHFLSLFSPHKTQFSKFFSFFFYIFFCTIDYSIHSEWWARDKYSHNTKATKPLLIWSLSLKFSLKNKAHSSQCLFPFSFTFLYFHCSSSFHIPPQFLLMDLQSGRTQLFPLVIPSVSIITIKQLQLGNITLFLLCFDSVFLCFHSVFLCFSFQAQAKLQPIHFQEPESLQSLQFHSSQSSHWS